MSFSSLLVPQPFQVHVDYTVLTSAEFLRMGNYFAF